MLLERKTRFGIGLISVSLALIAGTLFIKNIFASTNDCVITGSLTYTQADLNTCAGGSIDNLIINEGSILTLTEPITVNSTITIDGTLSHVAEDSDGINIIATDLFIGTNGKIDINGKGCGVGTSYGVVKGPNDSNVCIDGGYGVGSGDTSGGGAAHGGSGGNYSGGTGSGSTQIYDDSFTPHLFGAAGGHDSSLVGGPGGGYLKLNISNNFTNNGQVIADGTNGGLDPSSRGGGGGSGGSVHIKVMGAYSGSGTFSAHGGAGGDSSLSGRDGGGGGGGRIAFYFASTTETLSTLTSKFNVRGGIGGNDSSRGTNGTAIFIDMGFDTSTYTDGSAYVVDGFRFQSGEENDGSNFAFNSLNISGPDTTVSGIVSLIISSANADIIASNSITLSNINFTSSTASSVGLSADTINLNTNSSDDVITLSNLGDLTLTASNSITSTIDNLTVSTNSINFATPNSIDLTFTDTVLTATAKGLVQSIAFPNNIDLTLGTSSGNNSTFTGNLTQTFDNLTINTGSTIAAAFTGCRGGTIGITDAGQSPNNSNVCSTTNSRVPFPNGGGGHGGAGGNGEGVANSAGIAYDSNTNPSLFGAGGARHTQYSSNVGGHGGGLIYLTINNNLTLNGIISANGGAGNVTSGRGGGGGAGGSIYIDAVNIDSTACTIQAKGGNGGDSGTSVDGGGGSGGRIAIYYLNNSAPCISSLSSSSVTGGTSGAGGNSGASGTVYTLQYVVPAAPNISYPLPNSYGIQSTDFNIITENFPSATQYKTHLSSDWKIQTGSDCSIDSGIVWSSYDNNSNKTSINVDETLVENTIYYACSRHTNLAGDSNWSSSIKFKTAVSDLSSQNYDFSNSTDYTFGNKLTVSEGIVSTAASPWYNSAWAKRKPITITENSGSQLTNYQVKINLTNSSFTGGSDNDAAFDSTKNDGSDIRFTDSDGVTLIDHWTKTWTYTNDNIANDSATIWVEVPSVSASSNKTIFMYYGNSGASSASNSSNTMLWYDDFSTNTLSNYTRVGAWTWNAAGYMVSSTSNTEDFLRITSISDPDVFVEIRARSNDDDGTGAVSRYSSPNFYYTCTSNPQGDNYGIGENNGRDNYDLYAATGTQGGGDWITTSIGSYGTRLDCFYEKGTTSLQLNTTDNSLTDGVVGILSFFNSPASNIDYVLVRDYVYPEPTNTIGAEMNSFSNNELKIVNNSSLEYYSLYNLTESLGSNTSGNVKYQISNDNTNWYYFDTSTYQWISADSGNISQTNSASEVNAYLAQFPVDISSNYLYIASYLLPNNGVLDLNNLEMKYIPRSIDFSASILAPAVTTANITDDVIYTATITNSGNSNADNMSFELNVPIHITYIPNTITLNGVLKTDALDSDSVNFDQDLHKIIVNLGTINTGASQTITFGLNVTDEVEDGTVIITDASLSGPSISPFHLIANLPISGGLLTDLPSGTSVKLASDSTVDPSQTKKTGNQNINFKKNSNTVASFGVNMNKDRSLNGINWGYDTLNKKSFFHGFSSVPGRSDSSFTLFIPHDSSTIKPILRLCVGAANLNQVEEGCDNRYADVSSELIFNDGDTQNGITCNLEDIFWACSGVTGTGGSEESGNNLPISSSPSNISQSIDGSGYLSFETEISDSDNEDTKLKVEYSDDGGTSWHDAYIVSASSSTGSVSLDNSDPYQIGATDQIDSSSGTSNLIIIWDTKYNDITDDQNDIKIRLTANDSYNDSVESLSDSFEVDNASPAGMGNFIVTGNTSKTISVNWDSVSDENNFLSYEICYSENESDIDTTCNNASTWGATNDVNLSSISTDNTTITGLTGNSTYYMMLTAADDFGNTSSSSIIAFHNNGEPIVSGITAVESNDASHDVQIQFVANDADGSDLLQASIRYSIDGGNDWFLAHIVSSTQSNPATADIEPDINNGEEYNIGSEGQYIHSSLGSNIVTVIWDSDRDLSGVDINNAKIRVKIYDQIETSEFAFSDDFILDQVDPEIENFENSDSSITSLTLTWDQASESNFDQYMLFYGLNENSVLNESSSSWTIEQDDNLNIKSTTQTVIDNLEDGTAYYIKLKAIDQFGNTFTSPILEAQTDYDEPPAIPANLTVTESSDSLVNLDWDDNSEDDFDYYTIYKSTSSPIIKISDNILVSGIHNSDYSDTQVTNGIQYYYALSATDERENESALSSEVDGTPHDLIAPNAPANLIANIEENKAVLNWDDNSEDDFDYYKLYRSRTENFDIDENNLLADLINDSQFTDETINLSIRYYYKVIAVDTSDNLSSQSNEVSVEISSVESEDPQEDSSGVDEPVEEIPVDNTDDNEPENLPEVDEPVEEVPVEDTSNDNPQEESSVNNAQSYSDSSSNDEYELKLDLYVGEISQEDSSFYVEICANGENATGVSFDIEVNAVVKTFNYGPTIMEGRCQKISTWDLSYYGVSENTNVLVRVIVDPDDSFLEVNEDNNSKEEIVPVTYFTGQIITTATEASLEDPTQTNNQAEENNESGGLPEETTTVEESFTVNESNEGNTDNESQEAADNINQEESNTIDEASIDNNVQNDSSPEIQGISIEEGSSENSNEKIAASTSKAVATNSTIKNITDCNVKYFGSETLYKQVLKAYGITENKSLYFDVDSDGLNAFDECKNNTNPLDPDTDKDFLMDGKEVKITTNPLQKDTDGDNFYDGVEIKYKTDPLDPNDFPNICTIKEKNNEDWDLDGLPNKLECDLGTDPENSDSDSDSLSDSEEYLDYDTNPLEKDDKIDLKITFPHANSILATSSPFFQCVAQQGKKVDFILEKESNGEEINLGSVLVGGRDKCLFNTKEPLQDGNYFVFIKSSDQISLPVRFTIDTSFKVDAEFIAETLANKSITQDILDGNKIMKIMESEPDFIGKLKSNSDFNHVELVWHSVVSGSVALKEQNGRVSSRPPRPLEIGGHDLYISLIDANGNQGTFIKVPFEVTDSYFDYLTQNHHKLIFILLILLLISSGGYYYYHKKHRVIKPS